MCIHKSSQMSYSESKKGCLHLKVSSYLWKLRLGLSLKFCTRFLTYRNLILDLQFEGLLLQILECELHVGTSKTPGEEQFYQADSDRCWFAAAATSAGLELYRADSVPHSYCHDVARFSVVFAEIFSTSVFSKIQLFQVTVAS